MTEDALQPVGPGATTPDDASTIGQDAPSPRDDGDRALLALIDRLAVLLDRSDLTELEVESGGTGLTLRKPGAEIAADSTRPHHGDAHVRPLTSDPRPVITITARGRPDKGRTLRPADAGVVHLACAA